MLEQESFQWKPFLQQWGEEIVDCRCDWDFPYSGTELSEENLKTGWLGYAGATEEQLTDLETRLGVQLPLSYKAFLRVTNGWRLTCTSVKDIWSTERVDWFRVEHQYWIDELTEAMDGYEVPDEEYFYYGVNQTDSPQVKYLPTALQISDVCDLHLYLLNPQVVFDNGEWEAWAFSAWGVSRYKSFQEMMEQEYKDFIKIQDFVESKNLLT